jgi:hypothetical protein
VDGRKVAIEVREEAREIGFCWDGDDDDDETRGRPDDGARG